MLPLYQNVVGLSETTIKEVLQNLGLTGKEAEVYIHLAKRGPTKGVKVAKQLRKHKAQIYRILRRLQAKNLVEATLEAPTRFAAVPFEKALDQFIKIKQEEAAFIEKAKEDWLKNWERISKAEIQTSTEKFAVIEGSKKIYSRIIQMITETKKQFSAILSVPGLARGEQFGIFDAAYNHPLKVRITFQVLTDLPKKHLKAMKLLKPKLKTDIDFRAIESGLNSRLLPRMVIRDGKEILFFISPKTEMFSTGQNESCLFINSKSLVQTLAGTFEDLWKDSIDVEDKIREVETGRSIEKSLVKKDSETASIYDTAFHIVKEQLSSLPLLTAQLKRIEHSLPTFVGRQKELSQLRESLDKAVAGKGTTVFIHGEAGIGKTRLVNEFILDALSKNFRVLRCDCSPESGITLHPFREIFKELFDVSREDMPDVRREKIQDRIEDVAPHFMSLASIVDNISSNLSMEIRAYSEEMKASTQEDLAFLLKSEAYIANLAELLIRFSDKQPIMLFVDDLHIADSSSLKLFKELAKLCDKSKFLLIGAYRQEDIASTFEGVTHPLFDILETLSNDSLSQKIDVARLKQIDCSKLINTTLGIYNYNFEKLIYKETEGNPFFILETIKFLINKKTLALKGEEWELTKELSEIDFPHTIRAVISGRIYNLKDEERDILDCASIVGEQFSSDLIENVTGFSRLQVLRKLNRIERKFQLIHSFDGKYRFDHAKIREVMYQQITPELRKEYHSLIAEKLEKSYRNQLDDVVDQLAYHYYKSANAQKAVPYLIRAGKKSRKELLVFETIRYFSQALEMMKDDKQWNIERTETLETLGDLYAFIAEHEMANECYLKAIASADEKASKERLRKKIRKKNVVENEGVKLTYYVYGEGDPTILFVSWACSTELWIPQVTYFSQKYKVVTFDMRGTGESDKPPGKYTVDGHAEDLNVIVDDLQTKNVIVVGAHNGGKIAIIFVTKYPGKTSKLVLFGINPAPISESVNFNKKMFEKWRQMALKSPSWFVNGYWKGAFRDPRFESLRTWSLKSCQRTPPEIFRDGIYSVWNTDVRPLLERINIPTLITGGNKNTEDLARVKYLQEKIPNSTLKIFEGESSSLLNIFAASKFNQLLENYLYNKIK